jgi:hypothetical protein
MTGEAARTRAATAGREPTGGYPARASGAASYSSTWRTAVSIARWNVG